MILKMIFYAFWIISKLTILKEKTGPSMLLVTKTIWSDNQGCWPHLSVYDVSILFPFSLDSVWMQKIKYQKCIEILSASQNFRV